MIPIVSLLMIDSTIFTSSGMIALCGMDMSITHINILLLTFHIMEKSSISVLQAFFVAFI